jgi:ornithine carbamoyltransferase
MTSLISLADLTPQQLTDRVTRACALYQDRHAHDRPLAGQLAGILFLLTSTRTRTAFTTGALRLGADVITYGPHDLQLNTGETIADTGRIFAAMLDLVVARIPGRSTDLRILSAGGSLPVVNAMSADEHPTQAITDLAALHWHYGSLADVRLLYVGEGNNTAVALARALAMVPGARAWFWSPAGYGLPAQVVAESQRLAAGCGARIIEISYRDELPTEVDVVYTTQWQTTGSSKADPHWREVFRPLHVDRHFLQPWPDAVVMHDLPARRGEEIAGEVLDGPRSIAWMQAAMKLPAAMAVLERSSLGQQRPDTQPDWQLDQGLRHFDLPRSPNGHVDPGRRPSHQGADRVTANDKPNPNMASGGCYEH